ncbi:hypothetical protein VPH35_137126 [Triticum aestivum]
MEHGTSSAAALWGHEHLPLLARARSKDSVEYILQALWRTRRTGLDAADRAIVRDILQLPSDSELDPLLVCLRILIRRCVHDNIAKEEIPKLFPAEVLPELQRLLTLLLQKFQPEWREDTLKDQASAANSGTTKGHLSKNQDASEQPATTQIHCGTSSAKLSSESGEKEGKLPLAKDSLDKMLNDTCRQYQRGSWRSSKKHLGKDDSAASFLAPRAFFSYRRPICKFTSSTFSIFVKSLVDNIFATRIIVFFIRQNATSACSSVFTGLYAIGLMATWECKLGYRRVRPWEFGHFNVDFQCDGRRYWLGTFETAKMPARTYDIVVWRLSRPWHELNFLVIEMRPDVKFIGLPVTSESHPTKRKTRIILE